ncbi:MAG: D-alanine--D-alanine ligase [Dehalococcoidia bacterium]|nr:D-alanine--D-alanine ligase [Dehalococcoidia bacterium]
MARQRVAVIFGGRSGEHEVSLRSARSVMGALDAERWEVAPIGVTRAGAWLSVGETEAALAAGAEAFEVGGTALATGGALAELGACDVAFPLIHGTYGEDGCLQGLLEMAGIPYAGAGVAASGVGMDKALQKALFREAGIPVARYVVLRRGEIEGDGEEARRFVEDEVGYPCFTKPANGGSSIGITRVASREDLGGAFAAALGHDEKVVVEQAIDGREVECSVVGNEAPEAARVVGEIEPDREFYDYDSKYATDSRTTLHVPARIDTETSERVRELARRMYLAMGCEGYARVDFFVGADGTVTGSEVNTIPGFTSISMFPRLWEASGLAYPELLTRILDLALERGERGAAR